MLGRPRKRAPAWSAGGSERDQRLAPKMIVVAPTSNAPAGRGPKPAFPGSSMGFLRLLCPSFWAKESQSPGTSVPASLCSSASLRVVIMSLNANPLLQLPALRGHREILARVDELVVLDTVLAVVELLVAGIEEDQFPVGSAFHDFAFLHHQNLISALDGA